MSGCENYFIHKLYILFHIVRGQQNVPEGEVETKSMLSTKTHADATGATGCQGPFTRDLELGMLIKSWKVMKSFVVGERVWMSFAYR